MKIKLITMYKLFIKKMLQKKNLKTKIKQK